MSKPFKFRYVNEIAGGFAAVVVLVLVIGVVLAARAQKWFERVDRYTIELPVEGSFGLKNGADVRMMGTTVGTVDAINPPSDDGSRMTARIHVDGVWAKYIRKGIKDANGQVADLSKVIIRVPIALADPYIDITRGKGEAFPQGAILSSEPETGATDAINQTLVDVRTHTIPAIERLLKEYTGFASDLRSPGSSFQQALAKIDMATARLQQNDNMVGRLLTDKQVADNLTQTMTKLADSAEGIRVTIDSLQKTAAEFPKIATSASNQVDKLPAMVEQTRAMMADVDKAVKDLQQTTSQLPGVVLSLKQAIDQLPDVLAHTQQTLVEVQKLARGLQQLPFVRDNVEQSAQSGTLRPADIGGPP